MDVCVCVCCRFADYLPGVDLRFDNPVKHGASSLLLLLDVAMSRVPLVSYHLQVRSNSCRGNPGRLICTHTQHRAAWHARKPTQSAQARTAAGSLLAVLAQLGGLCTYTNMYDAVCMSCD